MCCPCVPQDSLSYPIQADQSFPSAVRKRQAAYRCTQQVQILKSAVCERAQSTSQAFTRTSSLKGSVHTCIAQRRAMDLLSMLAQLPRPARKGTLSCQRSRRAMAMCKHILSKRWLLLFRLAGSNLTVSVD